MTLLTEQEIREVHEKHSNEFLFEDTINFARAIEAKVIEKIKAQGPAMLYHGICIVDCGAYGHSNVELLKLIPAGTKLYRLPERD